MSSGAKKLATSPIDVIQTNVYKIKFKDFGLVNSNPGEDPHLGGFFSGIKLHCFNINPVVLNFEMC